MKPVKLVTVFAENRQGQLSRCSAVLADAGINIHWVNIADSDGFGLIRFLVDKTRLACEWLRQHGFTVTPVEVLAVEVPNQPGGLHQVVAAFADRGMSLGNCSGFVMNQRAILLIEIQDLAGGRRVIADLKLHQLTEDELLAL